MFTRNRNTNNIIYDGEKVDGIYVSAPKIKIGDGIHTVTELPFEGTPQVEYLEDTGVLIINEF